jgi:hypothetical protein
MKDHASIKKSLFEVMSIGLLLGLWIFLPTLAVSQPTRQSSLLVANYSEAGVEIQAQLTGSEIISIDLAGPDGAIEHTESKESPVFLTPPLGASDGAYRYEVQLVDKASGKMLDRLAGMFVVENREVVVPKALHRSEGFVPGMAEILKSFAQTVSAFIVSEAWADNLEASSGHPSITFWDDSGSIGYVLWDIIANPTSLACPSAYGNFAIHDAQPWQNPPRAVFSACSSANNGSSFAVDGSGNLHFANEGMFFDRANKRLGIGLTTPAWSVDVVGDMRVRNSIASDSPSIAMAGSGIFPAYTDFYIWNLTNNNTYLISNMVGVGTLYPASKLHVVGPTPPQFIVENTSGNGRMDFRRSSSSGVSQLLFGTGPLASGTMDYQMGMFLDSTFQVRVVNDSSRGIALTAAGNVGIGTTAPTYKLHVAGTVYATGGYQSSDGRLKENVSPIAGALDKVMQLEGVSFTWKQQESDNRGFPEGTHYGVIAQQVEKVLPEVVKTGAEGEKSVAYTELVPVLIEAMKQQQEMMKQQQEVNREQQKIISELQGRLASVEQESGRKATVAAAAMGERIAAVQSPSGL